MLPLQGNKFYWPFKHQIFRWGMKLALLPIHQLNHCVAQIPTFQPIFRKQLCFSVYSSATLPWNRSHNFSLCNCLKSACPRTALEKYSLVINQSASSQRGECSKIWDKVHPDPKQLYHFISTQVTHCATTAQLTEILDCESVRNLQLKKRDKCNKSVLIFQLWITKNNSS